jgi:protein phosphatase 1L
MVKGMHDAELAAKRLAEEAFQRGSADNISCIVVKFSL